MLESFLIKLQACKFINKRLQHWCFHLHVRKFLRAPILNKYHRTAASDYSFTSAIYKLMIFTSVKKIFIELDM